MEIPAGRVMSAEIVISSRRVTVSPAFAAASASSRVSNSAPLTDATGVLTSTRSVRVPFSSTLV